MKQRSLAEVDKLPALFKLVIDISIVVNGRVGGPSGEGLNRCIMAVLANQAALSHQVAVARGLGFAGFSVPQSSVTPSVPAAPSPPHARIPSMRWKQ